ncbi:hypothetical protein G7Z17_g8997 [Cylindrodendrum hubeiense]|uniref:Zn(2)-C6 fungal-type domain-containing protein n=1 Tax=Cylindrodendrum hubeiense TaxID=595255 RepID=A0A9P5H8M6_9HYPO|nr:hypothetical protein G7Z17_g8997 [Cylindrodendrum hubeiense]
MRRVDWAGKHSPAPGPGRGQEGARKGPLQGQAGARQGPGNKHSTIGCSRTPMAAHGGGKAGAVSSPSPISRRSQALVIRIPQDPRFPPHCHISQPTALARTFPIARSIAAPRGLSSYERLIRRLLLSAMPLRALWHRKREGNDADSFTAPAASTPAKRQRVSLACDSCRTAREKCDGNRPHCGTCTTQNRPCSYTPASRKRGVQTGYLRTIELSLAWLFEQVPGCEGALHHLLTQNEGAEGARILATKDKAGHRLYRRWSKSRIHKDIGRLLSDEKTPRTDTSADDSETEEGISPANPFLFDTKPSPDFSTHAGPSQGNLPTSSYAMRPAASPDESARLMLPSDWERLVDIYFTYTHCWFPIIDRDAITSTAMRYPPEGLRLDPNYSSALHAQLWAVLAVSAFQDASSSGASHDGTASPSKIYSIARSLIPPDDGDFETPHICAILIQSLILLGQAKSKAAWLLIGKASRLALSNRSANTHMFPVRQGSEASLNDPETRVIAAAFMLDTLASLCLGHPEVTTGMRSSLPSDTLVGLVDPDEAWAPIPGVGPTSDGRTASPQTPAQPLPTFRQLYAFSKLWAASMDARMHDSPTYRRITPEDLVKSLDTRFSFCNSLIFGGSTPTVPSAFLLQGMFLTVTLDLVPGHRPSLFSNLLEVVESCLENFGASGTPPLMITLMEIVQRHGHSERMHEHDNNRWKAAIESLQSVWRPDTSMTEGAERHPNMVTRVEPVSHRIVGAPPFMEELSTAATYRTAHRPASISGGEADARELTRLPQQKELLSYERHRYAAVANSEPSPGTSQSLYAATPTLTFQSPPLSGGHTIPIFQHQHPSMPGQLVDYDAILEELGSIDADGIDVDPQFMTNLGFAPGCDLGEMFQGDYGT